MNQAQQLASRFNEALINGKWVTNTHFKDVLSDVSFKEATTSYKTLNSIALLTYHINYYIAGVLEVFKGNDLTIRDQYSFDMPAITTETQWTDLRDTLIQNAQEFASHLSKLSDAQIEAPFVAKKYGNYNRNMNGMIEHCYYHLGQLVLIKKLLRT